MADPRSYRPAAGSIPDGPGVYRFRDGEGRVIYVGKAKSLRSRLSSYFADLSSLHTRTAAMVTTAASVDWVTVGTEVEALQLEYSWIKEYDPRFNVRYRDDKSYPFLAVTMSEKFPRASVMRGAKRKAPATSARSRTPGRSARRSTCCCGSSRCAPAPTASSDAPNRSGAHACWATSSAAAPPASGGWTNRSTR